MFKLESYERVDETLKTEEAEALVEAGSIMACNFRLSRNYFRLRPGDVYVYGATRTSTPGPACRSRTPSR